MVGLGWVGYGKRPMQPPDRLVSTELMEGGREGGRGDEYNEERKEGRERGGGESSRRNIEHRSLFQFEVYLMKYDRGDFVILHVFFNSFDGRARELLLHTNE